MTQKRPIVVAGNGPSLACIDYRRLPKEFDVFRVNSFFNEKTYYLGKNVSCYFLGFSLFHQFASNYLSAIAHSVRGIYSIRNYYIFYPPFHELFNEYHMPNGFEEKYFVSDIYGFLKQYKKCFHPDTPKMDPSTGLNALIRAVTFGYTDIYITGIEFSTSENWNYAFAPSLSVDKNEDTVDFKKTIYVTKKEIFNEHQSDRLDKALVQFITTLPGVNLYAVSENSPLSKILPLAPIQKNGGYTPPAKDISPQEIEEINTFVDQEIEEINTFVDQEIEEINAQEETQEPSTPPKGFIQKIKAQFLLRGTQAEWNSLRENIYLRLIYHAIKPFWVFIKYIFIKGAGNGK